MKREKNKKGVQLEETKNGAEQQALKEVQLDENKMGVELEGNKKEYSWKDTNGSRAG